jgi:hypothetical protein
MNAYRNTSTDVQELSNAQGPSEYLQTLCGPQTDCSQ